MNSKYQTELVPFLIDCLKFIGEQLELGRMASDRYAAVDAVAGLMPFVRERLQEDERAATIINLCFDPYIDRNHGPRHWSELAGANEAKYKDAADKLVTAAKTAADCLKALP